MFASLRAVLCCLLAFLLVGAMPAYAQSEAALLAQARDMTPEQIRAIPPEQILQIPADKLRAYATPEMLAQLTPEQQAAVQRALSSSSASPIQPATETQADMQRRQQQSARRQVKAAVGQGELKRFGDDLFRNAPSTFAPINNVPVPADYVMGPGDTVEVQLYGNQNKSYSLIVQRDGTLQFPNLGPIQVASLSFDAMRQLLLDRISKQIIGTEASITLGALRTIQVFVSGDAVQPGAYTVSALSKMLNALFASGGIAETGSFRNIELRRGGRLIARLDLYDLLLKGDTSKDQQLKPGDVIFIAPVGHTVAVTGAVLRSAIYELKSDERVSDVIAYAGGMLPTAYPQLTKIERIDAQGQRIVVDADFTRADGNLPIRNGDLIRVPSVLDEQDRLVQLDGHVNRPQPYQWREGMRVSDVVPTVADLKPAPDLDYALLVRSSGADRRLSVIGFRPRDIFADPKGGRDLVLQPRDRLIFFGFAHGRAEGLSDLIQGLKQQSRGQLLAPVVSVYGSVQEPGEYPLTDGMTLGDLLKASIATNRTAQNMALLVRRDPQTRHITVAFASLARDSADLGDFQLHGEDQLLVLDRFRGGGLNSSVDQSGSGAPPTAVATPLASNGAVSLSNTGQSGSLGLGATADSVQPGLNGTQEPGKPAVEAASPASPAAAGPASGLSAYAAQPASPNINTAPDNAERRSRTNAATDSTLLLQQLVEKLEQEATPQDPARVVNISGEVKFPGRYPLPEHFTVDQLIALAGGFSEPAYKYSAEITRQSIDEQGKFKVQTEEIPLEAQDGKPLSPMDLQPRDSLVIRRLPGYEDYETVEITGEVRFPGSYRARKGEMLSDLIKRAGGLTSFADANASVFTREALRKAEAQHIAELQVDLQRDISRSTLFRTQGKDNDADKRLAVAQQLSDRLSKAKAVGRLVIDLPDIVKGDKDADLPVLDGDKLVVPRVTQEVTVLGEVNFPTAHRYVRGLSAMDYIDKSGGETQIADGSRVYVIRANGEVTAHAVGWFSSTNVWPGDAVIVPLDVDPIRKLDLTTSVAQIMGQLAITAASLRVVGAY